MAFLSMWLLATLILLFCNIKKYVLFDNDNDNDDDIIIIIINNVALQLLFCADF